MMAEWAKEMRGVPVITSPPIDKWFMFHTRRNANEAMSLMQTLGKVSAPLGIRMQKAVM